jgi:hypothetical protein
MANFIETQQDESSSESYNEMEINLRNAQENKRSKRKFDWVEDKRFSNDVEAQMSINKSFINTITESTDLLLIYLQLFYLANCDFLSRHLSNFTQEIKFFH